MTQEDKQLLIKDLCTRLPYGVIGEYFWKGRKPYNRELTGSLFDELKSSWNSTENSQFLPYLRPMLSMTEEEQKEFVEFHCVTLCPIIMNSCLTIENEGDMFDWLSIDSLKKVKKLQKNLASSKICYLCAVKQLKRE